MKAKAISSLLLLLGVLFVASPLSGVTAAGNDVYVSDLIDEEDVQPAANAIDLSQYEATGDTIKREQRYFEKESAPSRLQQQQEVVQEQPATSHEVEMGQHHAHRPTPHRPPHPRSQHPHPAVYGEHGHATLSAAELYRERALREQMALNHRHREQAVYSHRDPYHAQVERQHEALRRQRLEHELARRRFEQQQAAAQAQQRAERAQYLQRLEALQQERARREALRQHELRQRYLANPGYRSHLGNVWPRHYQQPIRQRYHPNRHILGDFMDFDSGWPW